MTDELNQPLGMGGPGPRSRPVRRRGALLGVAAAAAAGVAALAALLAPKMGGDGQPFATARIEMVEPPKPVEAPPAVADAPSPPNEAERNAGAIADIERLSGVKVTRGGGGEAPGALVIRIEESGSGLAPAPDKRLVEKTRDGLLPRIGVDGAKPMDVYARPADLSARLPAGAPRLALVVGGVGLNARLSESAIDDLPGAVTLALAPYGAAVEETAARARARGHEILLQAPMEPFDYPHENPGPHTLRTGSSSLDDLHWLMSRFSGYVGVVNFLGARFTAEAAALTPVLSDVAARGLLYLDDGTSPRSLATSLASGLGLAAARADAAIDARAKPQDLDKQLAQLEALARRNGQAIATAEALPGAIARLSRFVRDLERRGIALVPVSALAGRVDVSEARAGRAK
ncbi:divergent polysaccharide deacetylase family protein [Methylosinus sp. Sm6]|uniref:divergent polysaccharide deacetylase family protein n=1 Tax=Methylosinus sp. Sm6 TaxID=2866948 RepID=UPI001C99AD23|nr:divergent polysaccharide deacetylase family protein [Methylosinus sp. Sm6]MBY6240604.1 divergent polysaccharide deacetylase family protein [Methylosinus sp. Sm6]